MISQKEYNERCEYLKQLGERIRAIRKQRGISVVQLAKIISMHRPNVNYIELGQANVRIFTLKKIAEALDVEIKDFL